MYVKKHDEVASGDNPLQLRPPPACIRAGLKLSRAINSEEGTFLGSGCFLSKMIELELS